MDVMPQVAPLPDEPLQAHYGHQGLLERILAALASAGADVDHLTIEDLAAVDQFHIQGVEATRTLAQLAEPRPGSWVLDIGCGIGGPARTLAGEFECRVLGVDPVLEYLRTATDLARRRGLEDRVQFSVGNGLDLLVDSESFDMVWLQHVNMNVPDKAALLREAARVLKPGGKLALHEICMGSGERLEYPVPWAGDESISFLVPPVEIRGHAEGLGLRPLMWEDITPQATAWFQALVNGIINRRPGTAPPPGLHLLMGKDAPDKARNTLANLANGRIVVARGVLQK